MEEMVKVGVSKNQKKIYVVFFYKMYKKCIKNKMYKKCIKNVNCIKNDIYVS